MTSSVLAIVALALTPRPAPEVSALVLGTYHMANPGLDLVKTKIRDTLGADRQTEIAALVANLAKFKPTKVIVEALPSSQSLNQAYRAYLDGKSGLRGDERQQVGFRLAKQFGHSQLYPVDVQMPMDFKALMDAAAKNERTAFLKRMQELPPKIGRLLEDLDRNHTVSEILATMNSPVGIWSNHSFYMEFLDVDNGQEFVGADVLGAWYQRNLRIFSNIKRSVQPGDRLLIIYGAGHAKLLSDFVKDTKGWKLEDPLKYLGRPVKIDWDL